MARSASGPRLGRLQPDSDLEPVVRALANRAIEAVPDIGLLLPCNVLVRETDDGTVLYRIVGSEEIAQSDDYLQTRNGQGGATSWTELVRGALHLSGQAEILNDLWFRSTDEQFIAETANAADAAAVAGLAQAMHWDRAMMDAALDWAQKQGFWV